MGEDSAALEIDTRDATSSVVDPPDVAVVASTSNRAVPSRHASASTWDADPPDLVEPARKGSERGHYARLAALLARDEFEFRRVAERLLRESESVAERVAALQVYFDRRLEPRYYLFQTALRMQSLELRVRDYALRQVTTQARRDPLARVACESFLDWCQLPGRSVVPRYRAEAAFAVLRWGRYPELRSRLDYLFAEADAGVMSRAAMALAGSDVPEARFILDRLERTHRTARVRQSIKRARADFAALR